MKKSYKIIYLDNNASTRIDNRLLDAMLSFPIENFANSSSTHHVDKSANVAIKNSRIQNADFIRSKENESIFTRNDKEAVCIANIKVNEILI